jgi:hypothetical protein
LNELKRRWLALLGILFVAAMSGLAAAQITDGEVDDSGIVQDRIPAEVLKTEAGRQMAERLKFLRRSQASLGPKHPAYKGIQGEIDAIRSRLGLGKISAGGSTFREINSLSTLSDDELRVLIRRMALRIESLERRVDALERRLEVF